MVNTIVSETTATSQQVDSRIPALRLELLRLLHEWDRTESAVGPARVSCPCPGHTHNDANPSLDVSVQEQTDQRGRKSHVLRFKCWTRKHTPADILRATGEEFWLELFACWKGLPLDILKRAGIRVETDDRGRLHYTFAYHDLQLQELIGTRYRWLPKRFWFERGLRSSEALFVPLPVEGDTLCLVEGETDALALASAGFPVAGVAGKDILFSEKPTGRKLYEALSTRFRRIYISVEPDADAETDALCRQIAGLDVEVYLIRMQETGYKDPCAMLRALGGERFRAEWRRLMHDAERVEPDEMGLVDKRIPFALQMSEAPQDDRIRINDSNLALITERAWRILQSKNHPPRLFVVNKEIKRAVFLQEKDGRRVLVLEDVDKYRMLNELASSIQFYETREFKGRSFDVPSSPSERLALNMLATPVERIPLPRLYRVATSPVFTSDGRLLQTEGFHDGVYVHLGGLQVPPVKERPGAQDVQRALHLFKNELLGDFPFVGDADRAHALALVLNPFLRDLVDGPTPMFLIDAPAPGTGKSLLAKVCIAPAVGHSYKLMSYTPDSDEMEKRIIAFLRSGVHVALFDNVKHYVSCSKLEGVLTSTYYSGRILGKSETVTLLNMATWVMTANNPQAGTEISRRSVSIFLDARMENPYERTGFRHALPAWAYQNRGELVWAALTIIQHWFAQGAPRYKERTLGSFETWCEVMGGVLMAAGVQGFLGNMREAMEKHDVETFAWRTLVRAWWERYGTKHVTTKDLLQIAESIPEFPLGKNMDERSMLTVLGRGLTARRDRIIEGYIIRDLGTTGKEKARLYMLKPANETGGEFGVAGGEFDGTYGTYGAYTHSMQAPIRNINECGSSSVSSVSSAKPATQHKPATQTPPALEEIDPFASADPALFLQECCMVEADAEAVAGELFEAYERWSLSRGETPLSSTAFGKWLSAAGFSADKGAKGVRIRRGLRLRDDLHLFDDDDISPLQRLRDVLQRLSRDELLALIKQSQLRLQERPHVKLVIARVMGWERERVEYGRGYQERLTRFIDDLRAFTGWTVMKGEHLLGFVTALLLGRGAEFVGENGETLVVGARLKPDPSPPAPPDGQASLPMEHGQAVSTSQQKRLAEYEHRLETLDYQIPEREKGEPIMTRQESSFRVQNTVVDDVAEPTYPAVPEVDIPEPTPWSDVKRVVIDIETAGLDPHAPDAHILAIGWKDWSREHIWMGEERDILRRFLQALEQVKPELLAGYNLYEFDLPYLIARCEAHGLEHPFRAGNYKMKVPNTRGTLFSDRELEFVPVWIDGGAVVDALHLACRWDFSARKLSAYDLKTVAHELCGREREVTLERDNILRAYSQDRQAFRQYLLDDLRDTWAILETLAPAYHYVAAVLNYPYWKVWTAGNASLWEYLLEQHYGLSRDEAQAMADEKRNYGGGLVVARTGVYQGCCKIDVSSLYPSIMLGYGICTRKDTERISLAYLKRMTELRLELKRRARQGDVEAEHLQGAFKILINSLYGFLGTAGIGFNDMDAAEAVTRTGRALLSRMLHALEQAGFTIVEADTDGIIVQGDGERALQVAQSVLPDGFRLELDWAGKVVYCHARKNYVIFNPDGSLYDRRGGAYRSRDRNRLSKECLQEFIRRLAFVGTDAAKEYAREVYRQIVSGEAWELVAERRRVSEKNAGKTYETQALEHGYRYGDKPAVARAQNGYSFSPDEGYDVTFYARKWVDAVRGVLREIQEQKVSVTSNMEVARDGDDD